MRPNLVSYENCVRKVGNFVDNCVRYVSMEQTYVVLEYAKWATASQKKTVLGDSKRSQFGRKSEEDKVSHLVGMYSGYFSTEQIYEGYDDPIWDVALEEVLPQLFKECNVF